MHTSILLIVLLFKKISCPNLVSVFFSFPFATKMYSHLELHWSHWAQVFKGLSLLANPTILSLLNLLGSQWHITQLTVASFFYFFIFCAGDGIPRTYWASALPPSYISSSLLLSDMCSSFGFLDTILLVFLHHPWLLIFSLLCWILLSTRTSSCCCVLRIYLWSTVWSTLLSNLIQPPGFQ
jgi:hypothetical protein